MSSFAENQLKKYGWTKGQGLGKNAEGRKTPIIITKKNDMRGLGDNSVDWSFEWWDKVYTKTLDNIEVSKTSEGNTKTFIIVSSTQMEVKVSKIIKESTVPKNNMGIISTSESLYSLSDSSNSLDPTFATTFFSSDNESTRKSRFDSDKTKMKSSFYYGNFVKSSTGPLDLNGWKPMEINNESKSVDSMEKEKEATTSDHFENEEKQVEKQNRKKSKKKKRKCEEEIVFVKNEKREKKRKKEKMKERSKNDQK